MATYSPPPGTADIFPDEARRWRKLEQAAANIFGRYGYGELRTPIFEYTELFQKGLGGETEVVQKEMYTFTDRGGRSLTLRPEGTAGIMRALSNTDVLNGVEQRVYYCGPMFRGERPAAGRRRQFHQIGVENVGRCNPLLDVECLSMLMRYLQAIGLGDATLTINTRGALDDRKPAEEMLRNYFREHISGMCEDCHSRLERNVWRILDCKQPECKAIVAQAPDYISAFSEDSRNYFNTVQKGLEALGIEFKSDRNLVRGLDYYVHTVFEVTHPGLADPIAIAGGGRYELFLPGQKKPVPGVGFAAGGERLLLAQNSLNSGNDIEAKTDVYLIGLGEEARVSNLKIADSLRVAGLNVGLELEDRSFKAQLRNANRCNAIMAVVRGENEMAQKNAVVKFMADGSQEVVNEQDLISFIQKHIGDKNNA